MVFRSAERKTITIGRENPFSSRYRIKQRPATWYNNEDSACIQGGPTMIFRQILRNESGCASYLIGCARSGQAVVVDPLADLGAGTYALEAADRGLRIAYVLDTHIHADHRSAAQELARATGATLALPGDSPVEYPFHPLHDGDTIVAGAVRLQILHTPEIICLLGVDDRVRATLEPGAPVAQPRDACELCDRDAAPTARGLPADQALQFTTLAAILRGAAHAIRPARNGPASDRSAVAGGCPGDVR
jgi:hypothetical protein